MVSTGRKKFSNVGLSIAEVAVPLNHFKPTADEAKIAMKMTPETYSGVAVVVIENGKDDHLVPDESRQKFYQEMDDAGVQWVFHDYARTPHGFALPPTIGPPGHLTEDADRRSTMSMLALFRELYPQVAQNQVSHNAAGTSIPR